jgi:hypothetical protein
MDISVGAFCKKMRLRKCQQEFLGHAEWRCFVDVLV